MRKKWFNFGDCPLKVKVMAGKWKVKKKSKKNIFLKIYVWRDFNKTWQEDRI